MKNKIAVTIYTVLGLLSAYLMYWISSLNQSYNFSGGANCFIPIGMAFLVALYGLVRWILSRFK